MSKKHAQEGRKDRYFALHHYMLKTDAWKALSAPARAVYIQIGSRYDGFNNGKIAFSVRDAAKECGLANNTANRAFKELVDLGFIEETRHGGLSRKTRIASEWRMTAYKCDLTGAFKSVLFMQRGAQARDHRLARSRPQEGRREPARPSPNVAEPVSIDGRECLKRRYSLSQSTVDKSPECLRRRSVEPVFGGPPVSNDDTHIVYQSVVSSETTPLGPPPALFTVPPPGLAPTALADAPTPADELPSHGPTDCPTEPSPRPVAPASTIAA
jgi:hypothetical protein